MASTLINILLVISPLLVGGIIAALNSDKANAATEQAEARVRAWRDRALASRSSFVSILWAPLLKVIVKFFDWTDSFSHRGLKNGVRIAAVLYAIGIWLLLIYTAIVIAIAILIIIGIIKLLSVIAENAIESAEGEASTESNQTSHRVHATPPGDLKSRAGNSIRINQDTGVVEEEALFGWKAVVNSGGNRERVDPETGVRQEEGAFGWKPKLSNDGDQERVNLETGIHEKEGVFGWKAKVYSNGDQERLNPETGIREKDDLFGWRSKPDSHGNRERVNSENGVVEEETLFGWRPKR